MLGKFSVASGSPMVPRAAPDRSSQVSCRWPPVRRPVGHQPRGRHRDRAPARRTHDPHAVGNRYRLACERGLRDIQALCHERARPHRQHPPISAKRSGAPRPLGQIHPGAIGGRQPDRGAAVERAEVDPGRVRRAECREQKPAAVRAETAARGGRPAPGRTLSPRRLRPPWRTRASGCLS